MMEDPQKNKQTGSRAGRRGGKKGTFNERYGTSTLLMGRKRLDVSETEKNKAKSFGEC
jgi:hypothetical protein